MFHILDGIKVQLIETLKLLIEFVDGLNNLALRNYMKNVLNPKKQIDKWVLFLRDGANLAY